MDSPKITYDHSSSERQSSSDDYDVPPNRRRDADPSSSPEDYPSSPEDSEDPQKFPDSQLDRSSSPELRRPADRMGRDSARATRAIAKLQRDLSPVRNPHGNPASTPKSMSKQWCYTLNSPTRYDAKRLRDSVHSTAPKVEYHVFQYEVGRSGTLHVQGYICFASRCRMSTVKTLLGTSVHLEVTRGTPAQAADYCKDPDKRALKHRDYLFEFGVLPVHAPGARNDINDVKTLLDERVPMKTIAGTHFPAWIKYHKAFDKYNAEFVHSPRKEKSLIFVFHGETGTGKSAAAYAFNDAFSVPPGSSNATWFDAYDRDRNPTVLFDEFHGGRCSFTELLRITDKYPMQVNTKGGHLQFAPHAIVFTSNDEPRAWYSTTSVPHMEPFERRIDYRWEYWRPDSVLISGPIKTGVDAVCAALKIVAHSVARCHKGDPTYHPHYKHYLPFEVMGTLYYVVAQQEPDVPHALPALW